MLESLLDTEAFMTTTAVGLESKRAVHNRFVSSARRHGLRVA